MKGGVTSRLSPRIDPAPKGYGEGMTYGVSEFWSEIESALRSQGTEDAKEVADFGFLHLDAANLPQTSRDNDSIECEDLVVAARAVEAIYRATHWQP